MIPEHQQSLKNHLSVVIQRTPAKHALSVKVPLQTEHGTVSVHPAILLSAIKRWDNRKTYTTPVVPIV